jgi:predicted porin
MNKKLIAAAIAAVVAAPAVSAANTTLYGKAHVDIRHSDLGVQNNYSVNSNASRVGVKGSEDLGDGLKAIFGYEMGYNITDGAPRRTPGQSATSQISARNAYVGLSGGFGTLLAGRHDTPAKVGFYATGNDVIGDSIVDFNRIGFLEFRLDNAVAYISPNMSGFTFAGAIVPGESTTGGSNGLADAYSATLIYAGGGLKASVGYEVATANTVLGNGGTGRDMTIGLRDHRMWQVGASYTFGDFFVGAEWEGDKNLGGGTAKRDVWGLVGKYTMGNNYIMANYGENKLKPAVPPSVTTKRFGIGVGHKFSKRTQVYAAYDNQNNPFPAKDTSDFALGMIHTF